MYKNPNRYQFQSGHILITFVLHNPKDTWAKTSGTILLPQTLESKNFQYYLTPFIIQPLVDRLWLQLISDLRIDGKNVIRGSDGEIIYNRIG